MGSRQNRTQVGTMVAYLNAENCAPSSRQERERQAQKAEPCRKCCRKFRRINMVQGYCKDCVPKALQQTKG